jgi:uncharacterized protein (TIGR03067 family)
MVAGLTLSAPVPKDTAVADALKTLAGEWVVVGSETFGRTGGLHVGDVFKFEGDGLTHQGRGQPLEYRLRVSPKAVPSQMDWRPAEPKEATWSHRGIYKLDGDKLTVCVLSRFEADDEKDRPSEFRTKAGRETGEAAGNVLLVLERKGR